MVFALCEWTCRRLAARLFVGVEVEGQCDVVATILIPKPQPLQGREHVYESDVSTRSHVVRLTPNLAWKPPSASQLSFVRVEHWRR